MSATVQNSIWGRQNHKEAHESVVKATQNMGRNTSLYYFFFTRFFLRRFRSKVQRFKIQYGEDKARKKPRECCKSYSKHGKKN